MYTYCGFQSILGLANSQANLAKDDLQIAYDDAAGRASDVSLTGQDLGGLTLTTGVYKFDSSADLTGTLTLDAEGDPNAVFIFQIGTTLTTAAHTTQPATHVPPTGSENVALVALAVSMGLIFTGVAYAARRKKSMF